MILPRLIVLTALTSCIPAAALAADSPSTSLARAMRSDEIAVAGAKRAFLTGALEERFGPVQASCVRKVRHAEFTAGSARAIESVLSPSEIDTALAFFQSAAGVKYVEGLLRRLRAREGEDSQLPKVPAKEDIEPAEVAAIADFSRSDLGRKIMGKQMTESPAALAFGQDIMSTIAARCAAK